MRSFYLAQAARSRRFDVCFQALNQYTAEILYGLGETTVLQSLPNSLDTPIVIIDTPRTIPVNIVRKLHTRSAFVLMMDVLTEARMEADIVCDAMMTQQRAKKLQHSNKTKYLYGLKYACLDEQFRQYHAMPIQDDRDRPKLLVAFGGGDMLHSNIKFLTALSKLGFRGPAEIIIGRESDNNDELHSIIAGWRDSKIVYRVRDIARRMADADLVVTKLGLTQLEAFCVGRDCVVIEPTQAHLDLQQALEKEYENWPVCECGLAADDNAFEIAAMETMNRLTNRPQSIERGWRACNLVDGRGAERILDAVLQTFNNHINFQRRRLQ